MLYAWIAVLLGYLFGHFLAFWVLVFVTLILLVMFAYEMVRFQDLASVLALEHVEWTGSLCIFMWTTYVLETQKPWLGNLVRANLLR